MNRLLLALFALLNLSLAFTALPTQQQICSNDIEGFNNGVSQLITDILDGQDVWVIFSDLDALDEVSYHLQSSCKNYVLNLFTKQAPGQNSTQYLACGQLVSIVGSLLEDKDVPSFRASAEGGVLLSQEALGLADLLSKDCEIVLVKEAVEAVVVAVRTEVLTVVVQAEAEEEENSEAEAEENEGNEEGEAEEEDDEAEAENEEGEVRSLEKKADEDDSDEPDYLTNLIEITKPGDGDSGQQWKGGDYNKYMNVTDWQTGGFKRFYEAGLGDGEDDDILETEIAATPVIYF